MKSCYNCTPLPGSSTFGCVVQASIAITAKDSNGLVLLVAAERYGCSLITVILKQRDITNKGDRLNLPETELRR